MDVKISVRPSRESTGCESRSGVLIGASKWVGFDQGSWADWRGERQMAEVPKPPARIEERSSSWPAPLPPPFWSNVVGALNSRARDGGPGAAPAFGHAARQAA